MPIDHPDYTPWLITDRNSEEQQDIRARLETGGSRFGPGCYLSPLASICDSVLDFDRDCLVAADALIRTARLKAGENCTFNPGAYLQGKIILGRDVRIAPRVAIVGENHIHSDITRPITTQGNAGRGVVIGDDVWIGTGAVITDGVTVGSHTIIGAGAVVTKNLPDYVIAGGNPARVLRNRIETYYQEKLTAFCEKVRAQLPGLVADHFRDGAYIDSTENQSPVRAWCDAAELLAMFGLEETYCPGGSGLFALQSMQRDELGYPVLSLGYALEVLGSSVVWPYHFADAFTGSALTRWLEDFAWDDQVWTAGDRIDCLTTAFYQNKKHFGLEPDLDTLFGWLDSHVNPETGLWGTSPDRMQNVNGFYRLTRGSYAQFGHPLPLPEKAIDTILQHAGDPELFGGKNGTSCNVLDVIHPLWLCRKQTDYRYEEGRAWVFTWMDKIVENWVDGKGFSFTLQARDNPTLMGTEMWLSILYLMCDYVGVAHLLDYRPRGVHRTDTLL